MALACTPPEHLCNPTTPFWQSDSGRPGTSPDRSGTSSSSAACAPPPGETSGRTSADNEGWEALSREAGSDVLPPHQLLPRGTFHHRGVPALGNMRKRAVARSWIQCQAVDQNCIMSNHSSPTGPCMYNAFERKGPCGFRLKKQSLEDTHNLSDATSNSSGQKCTA